MKSMKENVKLHIVAVFAALFALALSLAAFTTRAEAAANKAARLYVSFDGKKEVKEEDWSKHVYSIDPMLPKTSKIKSGMTVTYKVYFPKTLLKKDGDGIDICMDLNLLTQDKKTGAYKRIGSVNKARWAFVKKEGKKVSLQVCKDATGAVIKNPSYASIKSSGKYYVVTMKDVLGKVYYDNKTGKEKTINTKTSYTIAPSLVIHGIGKFSGYIYLDELTVKAAKTQKVTFNKKDYKDIQAIYWGGKDWTKKLKITKL